MQYLIYACPGEHSFYLESTLEAAIKTATSFISVIPHLKGGTVTAPKEVDIAASVNKSYLKRLMPI